MVQHGVDGWVDPNRMAHLGFVPPYDDVTVQQTEQEEKSPALLSFTPRSISGERAIRLPLRDGDKNSSQLASLHAWRDTCMHVYEKRHGTPLKRGPRGLSL